MTSIRAQAIVVNVLFKLIPNNLFANDYTVMESDSTHVDWVDSLFLEV